MNKLIAVAAIGLIAAGSAAAALAQGPIPPVGIPGSAAPARPGQAAAPASPPLPVGAMAPGFQAKAYLGGKPQLFTMKDALKKGPVVLYFFPGAYTAGCNIEAKAFADAATKFKAAGAQIVGVTGYFGTADRTGAASSLDEAVKDFSTTHCNSQFPVVVATSEIIDSYHVANATRPGASNRTSYVITPDDKIALSYFNSSPNGHVENTLKSVQDWKAAQAKPKPRA